MTIRAGLTLNLVSAYRCKVARRPLVVDRCRTSTEIHASPRVCAVGGRCLPKFGAGHPRRSGHPHRDNIGEFREQAYVPAEQPPPSQGARFPPAHAHPRRPRHPFLAPPQGAQGTGSLTPAHDEPTSPACVVLPRSARLTRGEGFRSAVRAGRRAGSRSLVVHWHAAEDSPAPVQIGFVVSKAVGNAVARNLVKRRLRNLTREHLTELPGRGVLVVRALPAAAETSYADLGRDLSRGLDRVLGARSGT